MVIGIYAEPDEVAISDKRLMKERMLDWWGPVLWEAYGASEVGTTCSIGPEDWLAHPGSRPLRIPRRVGASNRAAIREAMHPPGLRRRFSE